MNSEQTHSMGSHADLFISVVERRSISFPGMRSPSLVADSA